MLSEELQTLLNSLAQFHIKDADIEAIVAEKLPEWKTACESDQAECIIFHQNSFGTSPEELLLMSVAIKYAKLKGKKEIRIIN